MDKTQMGENAKARRLVLPQRVDSSDISQDPGRPPGWTADSLTAFLEQVHRNRFATFVHCKAEVDLLSRIDAKLEKVAFPGGPSKPDGAWVNPDNLITPLLFVRCHGAYRAACEHALGTQVAEVYPQVRACLEYAGYALLIAKSPALAEVWLRRHDDVKARKVMRDAFLVGTLKDAVRKCSPADGPVFDSLYELSIDMGGHPNERAVSSNLKISEDEDGITFMQALLNPDPLQLAHALKVVARAGVCALGIFAQVFGPRFMLLGITSALPELRKGL